MTEPRPYTLIAELTHRCALRCAYCANPLTLVPRGDELDTTTWSRVVAEAEDVGVVQLHLSGGEPLLRADLEAIVERARDLGLYSNLVTSGVPATRERLARLRRAGLDAVQLSLQDVLPTEATRIAGADVGARKLEFARWVKDLGLPLTLNVVLHRGNVERVGALIALAELLGADRLELAHTQYLGWALVNRDALLPTAQQIARVQAVAEQARRRLAGTLEIVLVLPDHHRDRPKPCMDGWARRYVVVTPAGGIQPCHLAHTLPGFDVPRVATTSVADAWTHAPLFRAFRGEAWMPEPCRSCPERERDFGGCRCQAFALVGNAAATDPACALAPGHAAIVAARQAAAHDGERGLVLRGAVPA